MFKLISPILKPTMGPRFNLLKSNIQSQTNRRLFSFTKYSSSSNNGYNKNTINGRPNMALTLLGVFGVSSLYLVAHKPILNDAGFANQQPISITTPGSTNIYYDNNKPIYDGAFDGKLNYHQVAMGSMSGLIVGYAISRLSTVLFVCSIVFYLMGIYLRKQGIIIIDTKTMVKGAYNSISWDELLFDQVSFSVPFLLSFCISATL